jgi:hypothetical protein
MLYRKAPPTPPRLLLRIIATAGVGALVGTAGCSSAAANGTTTLPPSDASDDAPMMEVHGIVTNPDASDPCNGFPCGGFVVDPDASLACGDSRLCGAVILREDAGDAMAPEDAAEDAAPLEDASGPCHPCGVVVRPDE